MKSCIFVIVCAVALLFSGCRDKEWDEHGKTTVEGGNSDLLLAIRDNPETGKFYEALVKSGYDALLASAGSFTVLAPTNAAWDGVDMNDVDNLKKLVANHIAYEKKLSSDASLTESLLLVNGKAVRYNAAGSFNGAQITSSDHTAGNGVFHITDKLVEVRVNIWEYISTLNCPQGAFIQGLNHTVMDMGKSVQTGVDPATGAPLYDTAWMNVNDFLDIIPLDDEAQTFTYIVLQEDGFNALLNKFKPYYRRTTEAATDSLTTFGICGDFVFEGIADVAQADTLTNIFGVKIPVTGVVISGPYEASNGRVYVLDQSNILYREKIRPVLVEGESYTGTNVGYFVTTRYKTWASGSNDIAFTFPYRQRDTIRDENGTPLKHRLYNREPNWIADADSVRNTDFSISMEQNTYTPYNVMKDNAYVEYKVDVHSAPYEIHYVAYDEYSNHSSNAQTTMRLYQKLFVSMPDAPLLRHGNSASTPPPAATRPADVASVADQTTVWSVNAIENNYLGPDTCFVSVDTAGIHKERKMRKWRLKFTDTYYTRNTSTANAYVDYGKLTTTTRSRLPQFIQHPISAPDAEVMKVPRNGTLTMWVANTTKNDRNESVLWQGWLFVDYIKLVPVLPAE